MNEEARSKATRTIWTIFFFTLVIINANVVFYGSVPVIENVIMTAIAAVAATGVSVAVWTSKNPFASDTQEEKFKRGERVKKLIELMDEDEIYELRQRLSDDFTDASDKVVVLGDDGELRSARRKPR